MRLEPDTKQPAAHLPETPAPDAPARASQGAPPAADDRPEMDVYSGVRWSAVAKYGSQAVEMGVSVLVARILAPEAYGLLGMAIVITGFLGIFQDLGFGSAVVQRKQISDALLSSLFFVSLAVGLLLAAALLCGAPLASWVYGDDRVGPILAVLSVTFLLSCPTLVPSALLTRRLAFQRLAVVDICVSVVRGTSVIALALAGWGVWALVGSSIAGVATRTPLVYALVDWRPRWLFSWAEVRSVFGFGANLIGFSIFNYFARNADNLIIGIFLGPVALGYYSLAYRLMLLPRDTVTQVVTRVLFPAFSRIQDDDERLANAYLRACGAIAFITFPMMAGLAVVARPFVEVVLGDKWLPAVPLIWLLAAIGAIRSVGRTRGQLFLAKGRADWMFRWATFTSTLKEGGRSYRGFNLFHPDDAAVFHAIAQGGVQAFAIRNRQLCAALGKTSPQVSRILKRLCNHALIKKVGNTYKYTT